MGRVSSNLRTSAADCVPLAPTSESHARGTMVRVTAPHVRLNTSRPTKTGNLSAYAVLGAGKAKKRCPNAPRMLIASASVSRAPTVTLNTVRCAPRAPAVLTAQSEANAMPRWTQCVTQTIQSQECHAIKVPASLSFGLLWLPQMLPSLLSLPSLVQSFGIVIKEEKQSQGVSTAATHERRGVSFPPLCYEVLKWKQMVLLTLLGFMDTEISVHGS